MAPLLADDKQQELTSLTLETPSPTKLWIAVIGYAGQCDAVGKQTVRLTIATAALRSAMLGDPKAERAAETTVSEEETDRTC